MVSIIGFTGFVGQNLISYLNLYKIGSQGISRKALNESVFCLIDNANAVIHLAGKAHDLKNTSTPDEYYQVNTELTKIVFDAFLASEAKVFITLSSVKAIADEVEGALTEEHFPNPITHYGKSKLLAEQYILSKEVPQGKSVYILRPCMIHGPGNKGNLNLLYKLVSNNIPWPLGAFENKRSFCSIDNLMFIFKELIEREGIPSGIYNVADDEPLSTNDLIDLIAQSKNRNSKLWNISKKFIEGVASIGDNFHLPLNSERLHKLTSSYVVSNAKIKAAIGKPLPVSSREGLLMTFKSFNNK
ncbi:MAG: NAD-dependent epimerase/dehydratase family protein [Chitinophagaceae bacterium]|nr:NAD-dependent epimerase/dehydratase family protein [Chitinophagaceae bacterium]